MDRPFGIGVIALVAGVGSVVSVYLGMTTMSYPQSGPFVTGIALVLSAPSSWVLDPGPALLLAAPVNAVLGYGLWYVRRWAFFLGLVWFGVSAVLALAGGHVPAAVVVFILLATLGISRRDFQ